MSTVRKSIQVINGKAFEYSLLMGFYERLSLLTNVSIEKNGAYLLAKSYFDSFDESEQQSFNLYSSFAVNFLIDLEPRLSNGINDDDVLTLELVSDKQGQAGDVRDVLAIRVSQGWEIGISAKNNHRAVKHPRLSQNLDFGKQWLGLNCSTEYFEAIAPVFKELANCQKASVKTAKWDELGDYQSSVYIPVLDAFKTELLRLEKDNVGLVAKSLVQYLIGRQDFYKVIKDKGRVEIQAYNLYGTLNLPFGKAKAKFKVNLLKLPTRLIDISYQAKSRSTLIVVLNEGWQISFRIHNASSRVEPSLKFDINLVSSPYTLFTNMLSVS
ncbi:HaeIII family restriction endonuclease [Sphingobacterium hungaricum]|uniref:HaeIII family restriction endonuclease n=1 Tax=Sphingobacterium hungaricum TaxID=2082723 RepID=A0A928UZ97_9SPHI|nr:HaeIII family restriction endonuclease [Sphingobacterium hungaricum]MBE8714813.1 HaeIII family restriction endonuclease [Sphingobacterium hungaricum]